jgi:hypothetical protein
LARLTVESALRQGCPDDRGGSFARVRAKLRALFLSDSDRDVYGRAAKVLAQRLHRTAALARLAVTLA